MPYLILCFHSFIYIVYVKLFELVVGVLKEPMHIATPVKKSLITNQVCKSCKLRIESYEFVINLNVLEIKDFDVILSMDWLSINHIIVNCKERWITVNLLEKELVVCFKDTMAIPVPIILVMKVSTLLTKEWSGYLTYVIDGKKVTPVLKEISVVKDFLEMFPEDLSGLPPQRGLEFMIELKVNTVLLSKAPYRMASCKLKDLKVQLQELFDQGSVPWACDKEGWNCGKFNQD